MGGLVGQREPTQGRQQHYRVAPKAPACKHQGQAAWLGQGRAWAPLCRGGLLLTRPRR